MLKQTLSTNLKKQITKNNTAFLDIPKGTAIRLKEIPQFYSNEFLKRNQSKIYIKEYDEENIKIHQLLQQSLIDKSAKSDMIYYYNSQEKIIRDISQIIVNTFYNSNFNNKLLCVLGNQAIIKALRYSKNLNIQVQACDSKKNFIELTNYHMQLNQIDSNLIQLYNKEHLEFLYNNPNTFDILDYEFQNRYINQKLLPAIRTVKIDGLLILNIKGFSSPKNDFSKLLKVYFNTTSSNVNDSTEFAIRALLSKLMREAKLVDKSIEVLYTLANKDPSQDVLLFLKVKPLMEDSLQQIKPRFQCRVCCQECSDIKQFKCSFNQCEIELIAQYYDGQLQNQEFIRNCIQQVKYSNEQAISNLFKSASLINSNLKSFNFIKLLGKQDKDFYNFQLDREKQTNLISLYNYTILSNLKHSDLMVWLKSFIVQKGLYIQGDNETCEKRRKYFDTIQAENLIHKKVRSTSFLIYPSKLQQQWDK